MPAGLATEDDGVMGGTLKYNIAIKSKILPESTQLHLLLIIELEWSRELVVQRLTADLDATLLSKEAFQVHI